MRYDLAIFDFDGTLTDSGEWFFGSLNEVADRFGFRRTTIEERESLRRMGNREIIRQLRVPLWRMPAIARHMRKRATRDIDSIRLFDGAGEVLIDLKARGVRLAIVSSNTEDNVRTVLGAERASAIDFYGCGSSLFGKAAKFKRAMRALSVPPARTICIGDETRDIEAAYAVGAACAAVTWGYAAPEALVRFHPTVMIDRMGELAALGAE